MTHWRPPHAAATAADTTTDDANLDTILTDTLAPPIIEQIPQSTLLHSSTSSSQSSTPAAITRQSSTSSLVSQPDRQTQTTAGKQRKRALKRKTAQLDPKERWYCKNTGCTKILKRTSSISIHAHKRSCPYSADVLAVRQAIPHQQLTEARLRPSYQSSQTSLSSQSSMPFALPPMLSPPRTAESVSRSAPSTTRSITLHPDGIVGRSYTDQETLSSPSTYSSLHSPAHLAMAFDIQQQLQRQYSQQQQASHQSSPGLLAYEHQLSQQYEPRAQSYSTSSDAFVYPSVRHRVPSLPPLPKPTIPVQPVPQPPVQPQLPYAAMQQLQTPGLPQLSFIRSIHWLHQLLQSTTPAELAQMIQNKIDELTAQQHPPDQLYNQPHRYQ